MDVSVSRDALLGPAYPPALHTAAAAPYGTAAIAPLPQQHTEPAPHAASSASSLPAAILDAPSMPPVVEAAAIAQLPANIRYAPSAPPAGTRITPTFEGTA